MNPWFKTCTNGVFSGYDPPRTLEAAPVMAPPPNPVQDTGANATPENGGNDAAPASVPKPDTPEKTAAPIVKQKAPEMIPESSDPAISTPSSSSSSSLSQPSKSQDPLDPDQQGNQGSEPKEDQSHDSQKSADPSEDEGQSPGPTGGQQLPASSAQSINGGNQSQDGNDKQDSANGNQDPADDTKPAQNAGDKPNAASTPDQASIDPNIINKPQVNAPQIVQPAQTVAGSSGGSVKSNSPSKSGETSKDDDTSHSFDPANVLPYQMSQIHDALAPSQSSQAFTASQQENKPENDQTPSNSQQTGNGSSGDSIQNTQAQPNHPQGDDQTLPNSGIQATQPENLPLNADPFDATQDASPQSSSQSSQPQQHDPQESETSSNNPKSPNINPVVEPSDVHTDGAVVPPDLSQPSVPISRINQATAINGNGMVSSDEENPVTATILGPGAPSISVPSTPRLLGSSAMGAGSNSIFYTPPTVPSHQLVTTIAGQAVTADATAIVLPNSRTLTAGAGEVTLSGIPIALDASGEVVVGSETVTLATRSSNSSVSEMGGVESTGRPSSDLSQGSSFTVALAPPNSLGSSSMLTTTNGALSTTAHTFNSAGAGFVRGWLGNMMKIMVGARGIVELLSLVELL